MKKATTFEEAFQILDRAIDDLDTPTLRSLVDCEVRTAKLEIQKMGELSVGHVEELAKKIDNEVRENPILFIGGAAAAALAIGFLLSRKQEVYA